MVRLPIKQENKPFGPDLSSWQGTPKVAYDPDFERIKAAGASFVFIKKSQGTFYHFGKYDEWVDRAQAAGLIVFDYHYLSYESLPADQIPQYLTARRVSTKPFFDFENWPDAQENGPPRRPDYMIAWAHDFAIQLHAATGEWPGLYTYWWYYTHVLDDPEVPELSNCPLWEADYRQVSINRGYPGALGSWNYESFWQYTSVGLLDGVAVPCDLNIWNGTLDNLKRFAGM